MICHQLCVGRQWPCSWLGVGMLPSSLTRCQLPPPRPEADIMMGMCLQTSKKKMWYFNHVQCKNLCMRRWPCSQHKTQLKWSQPDKRVGTGMRKCGIRQGPSYWLRQMRVSFYFSPKSVRFCLHRCELCLHIAHLRAWALIAFKSPSLSPGRPRWHQ